MEPRKVKLTLLDGFIHYSLALKFAFPILIFVIYFTLGKLGLFGISPNVDIMLVVIPAILLAPISLVLYFIQRSKLEFQFIPTRAGIDESKQLIREIVKEQGWTIRSSKDNLYTIKTNPGFINQSWGQHITIQFVNEGLLVNSIADINKGSWLFAFGSNQKNVDEIRRIFLTRFEPEPNLVGRQSGLRRH